MHSICSIQPYSSKFDGLFLMSYPIELNDQLPDIYNPCLLFGALVLLTVFLFEFAALHLLQILEPSALLILHPVGRYISSQESLLNGCLP